ncbi:MAG: hypothetical protein IPL32_19575 [Chloracidobacterium sp.]|jgi:hypothetical protein|nr:hypothetical protein [Chloracidobacterium sp.]
MDHHTTLDENIDFAALTQLGSEWAKHGRRRIYFDPLTGWYGLRIERLPNLGTITAVYLRGVVIPESEGRAIAARLQGAKVYYDEGDHCFHGSRLDIEDFTFIVEQIRRATR